MQRNDSTRFVASLLSNLVNNLAEGIHKIKYKYGYNNKKCKTFRVKFKDFECFLEYTNNKDDLMECKVYVVIKSTKQKFDAIVKRRFVNRHKFSNHDINKFIFLL